MNANLYAHFEQHFPDDLDSDLLITENGRCVTYREAITVSARLANTLLDLGAALGDRVTVQVEKSPENLFLYLACLRAGLVYHPLNTAYTRSELSYFLQNAEPALVICSSELLTATTWAAENTSVKSILTLDSDGSGTLMDEAEDAATTLQVAAKQGTDMAALLYSSGTTGTPKGIMLSHDNLRDNAETLVELWGFTASDRLLHMLPIYHVHGLFVAISCVLMSGASMSWHRRFCDTAAIEALPDCTTMMGVPTFYTRLLANPDFNGQCCRNMRLFISGSAPLLTDTFNAFRTRTGHTILERYGMSETGMNTSNPLIGQRRAGTVGPAIPGVTLRIVDDSGTEVPTGEPGNLQVKGANVFSGYWRMEQKTAEDFTHDGFFNTGDKATLDLDGYVSIVGRAKDMVITGGLNVYPKEIEIVIDNLPGIRESAVIGIPDTDFGEAVAAVVVVQESDTLETDIIELVTARCKETLANFKVPKKVFVRESLPRNAMGKVQKNVLREQYAS